MLGSGAFSTCFQARDVQTGTLMAVKQIQLNRVQDDAEKERLEVLLQQEISLMSMFDHPNLIRFFGVVQEDPQLNIFVEWMPGGSVSKLLDKHGSFNDNVIMKYTYQILQGLDYLHHHGILHRDLKGANLFVDTTGHLLRIGDFGAAACLYTKMTCPGEFRGQLQGTLAFMAPEVLRGESYGRSCDIWSLGCCIIEMATAKQPWNAADISNYYCLMYKIACSQEPPVIPTHLCPGLQELTARCLQLIPDSRPQARELVHHPVFAELFH
jgi:mitogen-activated protein kinase kinase kinase 1